MEDAQTSALARGALVKRICYCSFNVDSGFNVVLRIQRRAPWRALYGTLGVIYALRWVYVRSTLGNLPSHLGLIFVDFR